MNQIVRVWPLPPLLKHNPYLDQLYGHIEALGDPRLLLRRPRPAFRGLLELLTKRGPRIWHLHLFDQMVQWPGRQVRNVGVGLESIGEADCRSIYRSGRHLTNHTNAESASFLFQPWIFTDLGAPLMT